MAIRTIDILALSSTLVMLLLGVVDSQQRYTQLIPNGCHVPNPCNANQVWCFVASRNPSSVDAALNPFGVDLAANDNVWDATLCRKDSDGDGRTNGQELGDVNCTWTSGGPSDCQCDLVACYCPTRNARLSHPGICEPLEHPRCVRKNSWLNDCQINFNCPAISEPDVDILEVVVPPIALPQNSSSYFCYLFPLPNDTKYHMIGSTPLLEHYDNVDYITVWSFVGRPSLVPLRTPYPCKVYVSTLDLIFNYQRELAFDCVPPQIGYPFGASSFDWALVQIHYTNPSMESGIVDSPGIRIYYTRNLRRHDIATTTFGQLELNIPPGQPRVVQSGSCTADCNRPSVPTSIPRIFGHMHYTGRSFTLSQYRNGSLLRHLLENEPFDFLSPRFNNFVPPIEYLPGDSVTMECHYDTTSKQCTLHYGATTLNDEMCLAIVTYYPPVSNWQICVQVGQYSLCDGGFVYPGCRLSVLQSSLGSITSIPPEVCTPSSSSADHCSNICVVLAGGIISSAGCLAPAVRQLIQLYIVQQALPQYVSRLIDLVWTCNGMPPDVVQSECIGNTTTTTTTTATARPTTTTELPPTSTTKRRNGCHG